MKRLYRHYSTWLLFVGIFTSFFAFLNGTNIYQHIQYALAEINQYKYKNVYHMEITGIEDMDDMLNRLSVLRGNILLTDHMVYVDAKDMYQQCEILLKQDEKLAYSVTYMDKNGDVIVGSKLEDLCFEEAGKTYIMLDGKRLSVAGIVASEKSDVLNYKLILTPKMDMIYKLMSGCSSIVVEYGSDKSDITTQMLDFYNNNCNDVNLYYEKETDRFIEVGSDNADEKFYFVIMLFSMINCVVISEFWILRRKQEIVIRKLWGFTNLKILKLLYGQMIAISFVAVLVVLIIQAVISVFQESYGTISLNRLGLALIFTIISSFITVILPIYKAAHFKVSDGLEMM